MEKLFIKKLAQSNVRRRRNFENTNSAIISGDHPLDLL